MNVPTGYTELDLVGFTDRGAFDIDAYYVKNDLSHRGGDIWKCLIDDTHGILPAEGLNWTLFTGAPTNMTEAIIAPMEESPATAAHAVGDQLIWNDVLYKVIQPIAIGTTLTVNTNIAVARKIVYQISGLESDIATIEPISTASQAYAVGEYLFHDWEFYRVITPIAQGDTIVTSGVSANVQEVTVGDELKVLAVEIDSLSSSKANASNQATIETNASAASQAYAVGKYLVLGGILYKVTSAISQGGAIVTSGASQNVEAVTIGDELTSLNNSLANQVLYYTSVACSATTGNFATVSNAAITADHVVAECTFANPSAITSDVTWTTSAGSVVLNGTCASATTANIVLVKKGN